MFSYYGSKSRIVIHYPKPKYPKIIEGFAGSARYSLKYFDNDVLMVDKYEPVIKIWHYLQRCSPNDILSLPRPEAGQDIRDLNLSEEEGLFMGMIIGAGSMRTRFKTSRFAAEKIGRENFYKNIASSLWKIKHWIIRLGSYEDIQNEPATWFIDPPYQFGGHAYSKGSNGIDFQHLAEWSMQREGQVIVCESSKADWLPFQPLVTHRTLGTNTTSEAIWLNQPLSVPNQQLEFTLT